MINALCGFDQFVFFLRQKYTARGPDSTPKCVISAQWSSLKKYKKLHLNDGDIMNEFKLHWTINNFATYYNPKQISAHNFVSFFYNFATYYNPKQILAHNFVFGPWVH